MSYSSDTTNNLPETGMRKISAGRTWFYKSVFPMLWFGILGFVVFVAVLGSQKGRGHVPLGFLFVPVFMAVFGWLLMKKLIFDLADEVWEGEDFLQVRFGNEKERIPFTDIVNINYMMMNPPRATVKLRQSCRFGPEIAFCPLTTFSDFAKSMNFRNMLVDELIRKVDAVRHQR